MATLALLRAEPLPRTIWEPACGPGAIVRILRDAGHRVIATDLADYRSPGQDHADRDILLERRAPDGGEMIVTYPPSKSAAQFAAHALSLCPRVAMLLRLTFLESTRRNAILDFGPLARVHVFRNRMPATAGRRGTAFQIRRQVDHRLFDHFPHRQQRVRLASQAEIEQQEIVDGTANGAAPSASCWRLRAASLQVSASEPSSSGKAPGPMRTSAARMLFEASASPRIWEIEEQARAEFQS